jgi:hypothetical protein
MTLVAAAPAPRGRLRLLAVRDFRLLWIGETTSSLGSSISVVALPLAALTLLHASVLAITVLTAAAWLPWLIVGLPAGAWVDRLADRGIHRFDHAEPAAQLTDRGRPRGRLLSRSPC